MNKETFTYKLTHPEQLNQNDTESLREIITHFPYFQAARALQLKTLKDSESVLYNEELKKTAAYTTDRSVLFDYITSQVFTSVSMPESSEASVQQEPVAKEDHTEELKKATSILDPHLFERKEAAETTADEIEEEQIEQGKPLAFDKKDTHSFSEWLKLVTAKPIERSSKPDKANDKFALIDKFISEPPKIDPHKEVSSENLAKPFTKSSQSLMTETLARVYVEQKNYKKAIQAYKILILKNPEKSGFFADQIRAIEKIQGHK